jgi:hypothetical protein
VPDVLETSTVSLLKPRLDTATHGTSGDVADKTAEIDGAAKVGW